MTTLYQDLKDKLARLHILEQMIVVNALVYLINVLLSLVISNRRYNVLDFLSLSNDIWEVLLNPWTIITYGFLHYSFTHLFFNMLVLYILARTFANLYRPRMALKIYILGIIFGAVFFSLATSLFSGILNINAPLIGASAGVSACIIFLCVYMPDKRIGLGALKYFISKMNLTKTIYFKIINFIINSIFIFLLFYSIISSASSLFNIKCFILFYVLSDFKLKYLGIALVIFDLPGLLSDNSGGTVAHIGGYVLGFYFAYQLQKGREIGQFLDNILDYLSNKKRPLKTAYRKKTKKDRLKPKRDQNAFTHQKQIDLILDKIGKSGYESLTQEEKDFLFRAGKK